MSKEICISSTPHETRLAILEDDQLTEIYYERENEYTLAGSIYKGRVTRVLPGMQSAFVDVGLERDAFLYVTDFLEEQEDSADFERLPANGGAAAGAGRRRSGSRTEAQESSPNLEAAETTAELDAESGQERELAEGAHRWRGRRGRRGRGLRGRSAEAQPSENLPGTDPDLDPVMETEGEGKASVPQASREDGSTRERSAGSPGTESSGAALLPGESLSKYGAKPQNVSAHAGSAHEGIPGHDPELRASHQSKPSTLIESPIEWSGSGLLPGESRASASAPVASGSTSNPVEAPLQEPSSTEDPPFDPARQEASSENSAQPEEADASASHRVNLFPPSELRLFSRASHHSKPKEETPSEPVFQSEEPSFTPAEAEEKLRKHGGEIEVPAHESIHGSIDEHGEDSRESAGDRFAALLADLHSAAPEGMLEEEEVTGEEEYSFSPPPNALEDHEFDEIEEQTLDEEVVPGGEVGDMVRDTHLEERVDATEPVIPGEPAGSAEYEDSHDAEELEDRAATAGEPRRRERRDGLRTGRLARRNGRQRSGRRQNAQTSDLPIISELLKQGQEILVQIAKEPIAKKGARITSHIALPGRFLVFMPTVNHVGVSRKISSDEERQRLKRILLSEKGSGTGGFIVRTAADGAGEEDLRADIRFLMSLWGEIKQRSDEAKSPALIYHDLNLVERILRDRVSDNFSAIWVDSESEYERIVRFLNRFQPSLVRRVKLYTKETPLFEQFGIQEEIGKALKSKVWLKSGGSIVINQTEALVAIDINTGKYVGKTARLEDTILKTNLDAIPEIVRQIRLRDLGGIIVIDFIDMDERRNRHKVMQALEEALKADRAPSKVLQFNDFGLVAITRKRVKQSLERTLCVPCPICSGTGMVKSPATVANEIYVEIRKMQRTLERRDVLLRVHPEVVKTLKANNGRWLTEIEEMSGKTVLVKSDPSLPPEQFDIH